MHEKIYSHGHVPSCEETQGKTLKVQQHHLLAQQGRSIHSFPPPNMSGIISGLRETKYSVKMHSFNTSSTLSVNQKICDFFCFLIYNYFN